MTFKRPLTARLFFAMVFSCDSVSTAMGMAAQTKPEAGGPPGVPLGGLRVNVMWFYTCLGRSFPAVDLTLEHGGAAEAQEGHDGYAGHDVEAGAAGGGEGTLRSVPNVNSKISIIIIAA